MFNVTSTTISYQLVDLPLVILLGVIGGLLGSFYNFLLEKVLRIYSYIDEIGTGYQLLLAGTISIFASCILFGLLWFASCQPCPDAEKEMCPTIGKTGAIYGRCVGLLMGFRSNLDHGLYAVLRSSFLGGTMRMTVSVCVVILELTNNLLLLPLVVLVLLISKSVADSFNGNIYDLILKLKGLPYLEGHAEPYMRQLTVSDVVMGPLRSFNGVEKVGNIVHLLKMTGHHGFPVIDEPPFSRTPVLFGLVLRPHLLVLWKKRDFLLNCTLTSVDLSEKYSSNDFSKNSLGNCDSIDDIELTTGDGNVHRPSPFHKYLPLHCSGDHVTGKSSYTFQESWLETPTDCSKNVL